MKHALSFAISVLISCAMLFSLAQPSIAAPRALTLTPQGARPFDGWGVGLAFDAYRTSGQTPAAKQRFLDALFSENGIGFNKIRYLIGGGQSPDQLPAGRARCAGCWVEGWEPSPGQWNDQADGLQRLMLKGAIQRVQARGLRPTLEALSSAPPYWMTLDGNSAGSAQPLQSNMTDASLRDYANYQVGVLSRLSKEDGVVFDTLSPMNEPNSKAWVTTGHQEGLYLDHRQQAELIDDTWSALRSAGLPTQVSGTEEMRIGDFRPNQSQYSALGTLQDILQQPGGRATLEKLGQINVHDYWGDGRPELRQLAQRLGKKIVISEGGCCSGWTGPFGTSFNMIGALTLAEIIRQDIAVLGVSSWSAWQATWGIFTLDAQGQIKKYPQYTLFSILTHALPAGSRLMNTGDDECIASVEDLNGHRRIGIVLFNAKAAESTDHQYSINLSAFGNVRLVSVNQMRSTDSAPTEMIQTTQVPVRLDGDTVSLDAPAHSLTSVILEAP